MIGSVIFTAPCLDVDFDGDVILFRDGSKMNIGRIFVAPEHFRKGYGLFIMTQIEEQFPDVTLFALDTPLWNVRTNRFTGNSRIQSMSGTTNSLTMSNRSCPERADSIMITSGETVLIENRIW